MTPYLTPPTPETLGTGADAVGLRDGDHACILFSDDDEHRQVIGSFLAEGVRARQRVLNIPCAHTPETMRSYLEDEGLDARSAEAAGQLSFLDGKAAYTPDGGFDPDAMVGKLMSTLDAALEAGWNGMRGTGDMSWSLEGAPGSDRIMEYEAKLNEVMPGSRFRAICQYDIRKFSPATILEVLTTHPIAFVGRERLDNFYFMPPEEYLSGDRETFQLRRWLQNLRQARDAEAQRRDAAVQQGLLERASEELAAKTSFLNTAAHELATPLTPLGLQVEVLKAANPQASVAQYARNIDLIGRGYTRVRGVVNQLLDAVGVEGSGPIAMTVADLCLIVQAGAAAFEDPAARKGVVLHVACRGPAMAKVDEERIAQVLDNLLGNALKFTPPGGRIDVDVGQEGSDWHVRVIDTGIGLAPDRLNRLFQPFSRLHPPKDGLPLGPGLGLFISRSIVMRHGGSIWGRNREPGPGSEFGFTLPRVT